MVNSTDTTAGFTRTFRETAPAKRAIRFHYLLAAPGEGIFGAAGFAFFSWLIIGAGITPVEAGTLAMLAFFPNVFVTLLRPGMGYGSLSIAAVAIMGCAEAVAGMCLVIVSYSPSDSIPKLLLLGVPLFTFSFLHYLLSASATDRLDALLPGHRGKRFRETLWFRTEAASIAVLLLAGIIVDIAGPERFLSYAAIFTMTILLGFSSILLLLRVPPAPALSASSLETAFPSPMPAHDHPSSALAIPDIAICFASGMLPVFALIFMISPDYLGLSLLSAAMYTVCFPVFAMPGRLFWQWAGDRFGAGPVLQLSIPLLVAVLLSFTLITREDTLFLGPLLGLSGFLFSGVSAGMDRAFGIASGVRKFFPGVYAAHGVSGKIAFALAPFAAGLVLSGVWGAPVVPFPVGTGDIQLVFFIAAATLGIAFLLLLHICPKHEMSLARAIGMTLRGNPFLFAWNALMILRARSEEDREWALMGFGRSGNPFAVPFLLDALGDPSPEVRRNAISALGKVRASEATPALINELEDRESDMRIEAAESLGKIGDRAALSPLLSVLHDCDIRLRNTAITALAEIGGDDIREHLFELFILSYDTDIFPTLADSLSRLGVREIVEPVMRRLGDYDSLMLRLQLLNAVCRALGAGNTFYRILSRHEYARVDEVNRLIRQARRHVRRSPLFRRDTASGMNHILGSIAESYRAENHQTFLRSVWEFMAYMQLIVPDITPPENESQVFGCGDGSHLRPHIEAVNRFLILKENEDIRDEGMVFLVICIGCLLAEVC